MPSVPFLVRRARSLFNSTEFRDVLTHDVCSQPPYSERGGARRTGRTAQQQETSDDR